jgi:hypothetical protein
VLDDLDRGDHVERSGKLVEIGRRDRQPAFVASSAPSLRQPATCAYPLPEVRTNPPTPRAEIEPWVRLSGTSSLASCQGVPLERAQGARVIELSQVVDFVGSGAPVVSLAAVIANGSGSALGQYRHDGKYPSSNSMLLKDEA